VRKLFDQDPWAGFEEEEAPAPPSKITLWFDQAWNILVNRIKQFTHKS
jgi:hypothetical protein